MEIKKIEYGKLAVIDIFNDCLSRHGQSRQYRQFLVGVLVGQILLVAFLCYETLVVVDNLVNHIHNT